MCTIKFDGKLFPVREVTVCGESVLVAGQSLESHLFSDDDYVSDEARRIDESIYGYVLDDAFELNDVRFGKYVNRVLD